MRPVDDVRREAADRLADDLDLVVSAACDALEAATDRDWSVPAAGLTWSCWGTLEHTADDLFAYAGQVSPRRPALQTYVPFAYHRLSDTEPVATVHAEPERGNAGLVQVLDATGGMLAAVVRTASPETRGWHPYGVSDPGGFAAMGTVETLLHLYDVAQPLGLTWEPDPDVVRRALDRLFPDAPTDTAPWATLLWATGRGELAGRERITEWRWDGTVR
jgi:hypothetical protein